jgi:hypothetical protein
MYRVQLKYHRQHVAFMDHRAYCRGQLRAAMRQLHLITRKAHRRRHALGSLRRHCTTQQKRRVLQLLDTAVARRWGQKQEARCFDEALATRRLHRGFRRLLKNGSRGRRAKEREREWGEVQQ